jgi:hypothetical protein
MGGGGNNPSCGCDMQAGWPPASEFPRGGLQGGGKRGGAVMNFNEFNLALSKNGRTRHLRGRWNNNNNGNNYTNTMNNGNNSNRNNNYNSSNMNNNNSNRNNNNNGNNMNTGNGKGASRKNNNNSNNMNNGNGNGNGTRKASKKLMYEGKVYNYDPESGNAYQNGKYAGKYIRPNNGKPYLMKNTNENSSAEYDTEEMDNGNGKAPKTLMMNGGKRTRKQKQKHGKRCPCLLCTLKKLKWAGGGR